MSIDHRESNLLEVSSLGNLKAVQQYIMGGVNPNCQHPMNKWTPLHWAVKRGHVPIVQYLLDNGSDPKLKNDKGQTPLDLAVPSDIRTLFKSKLN
jgi:ankyrin repeat protein